MLIAGTWYKFLKIFSSKKFSASNVKTLRQLISSFTSSLSTDLQIRNEQVSSSYVAISEKKFSYVLIHDLKNAKADRTFSNEASYSTRRKSLPLVEIDDNSFSISCLRVTAQFMYGNRKF